MARKKQTGTEIKLYQIDTMVYLGTKNIITKLSMFAEFLKNGGVDFADKQHINRARALERFDKDYKISDIKELTTDGQANETWLRKNGLLYSVGGRYELSPIANAILKGKITLADYCFLLLSKQWIKIKELGGKDEYKANLLSVILADLIERKSIPVNEFVSHIGQIALDKYSDEYDGLELSNKEAARYLIEPLLISKLIEEKDGKYILNSTLHDLAVNYVDNSNRIKRIDQVECDNEEYWNGFQYGIYDIIDDKNKHLYISKYPHLFAMKELYEDNRSHPLQQIFYGAPGTGKSHEIKKLTKGKSVIRTTFHPDSDYSTFVGAYKPTMEDVDVKVVPVVVKSGISLEDSGTYKENRIVYKFIKQAFLKAYLLAWKNYTDVKTVTSVIDSTSTGIDADDEREIISSAIGTDNPNLFNNGNPNEIPENNQGNRGEDKTKLIAKPSCKPVYLIIEEINRGNCAQIFGDLFQLLDRSENGFSEYPIEADTDLQQEIARAFKEDGDYKLTRDINVEGVVKDYISTRKGGTLSKDIQDGHILLLPPNLYIWATMNTSDQSLFPIDSAFKRRWEWEYLPIGYKNSHWTIKIGEKEYNWTDFQRKVNEKIYGVDNSEDKQLGDYFVNADRTGNVISADTLLNKILFYLWNDVCKDDPDQIFRWIDDKKEGKSIKFSEFFEDDKEKKLQGFMEFLEVPELGKPAVTGGSEDAEKPAEAEGEVTPAEEETR